MKKKVKKKEVDIKTTSSYKQGVSDCSKLLKDMSLWYVYHHGQILGLCRKVDKFSHPKLFRYCEGWNDCLKKHAAKLGITGTIGQEDIGK